MSSAPTSRTSPLRRPKYYDSTLLNLPPPGLVSIFHRISGALLFLSIPILLYLAPVFCSCPRRGFARARDFVRMPLVKLAIIGMGWLYAHHFFAGIRYLLLDLHVGIARSPARTSAVGPSSRWAWSRRSRSSERAYGEAGLP